MADKWRDERDRSWRERDWRRREDYGRGYEDEDRFRSGEARSWRGRQEEEEDERERPWGARRSGPERDRVFGERETGLSYSGEEFRGGMRYRGEGRGRGSAYRGGRGWQERDYTGVSPAMEQGEYEALHRERGYAEGGRYYGDDRREPIYREEYGQGGVEYGRVPRGYDAERERRPYGPGRHKGDYERRTASGGTGGYDYERGYGDAGRSEGRGPGSESEHETGHFLRRAGERVASWFGGGEGRREEDERSHRGKGPKGYKRADERVSEEAHERLTEDPWIDASEIAISVANGEVTLSGTVDNREAKHRAERIVEDITGVDHVQNNLRVQRGNPLTSPGGGYGDSVMQAQMRESPSEGETSKGPGARSPGGEAGKSRQ